MARENRRRQRSRATDWATVSIGIITVATIIAAATVAAAINISRGAAGLGAPSSQGNILFPGIAAGIALTSLGFYLAAVFTGLWSLFRKLSSEQEPLVKLAAFGFYIQVFAAVIFASVVIFGPLIAAN